MNIDYLLQNFQENGSSLAMIADAQEYTFDDIYQEYVAIEKILTQKGINRGNVVAVISEFSPRAIAYVLVLIERDSIIVPISTAVKDVDTYIRISQTEFIIDLSGHETISKTEASITHTLLKKLIAQGHPGLILFSSGTTGDPKAAVHDLTFLMDKFKNPGKRLSTVTFLLFDHIGGFNTMMHSLASGSLMATLKYRSPEEVCKIIEKYRIELLPTSPTFIHMLLLSKIYEHYDLSSLKVISYGTEPMPESTLLKIHELFPQVQLKQTYGLSEVGIMATKSESSDSLYIKLGGLGFETKIIDDVLYIKAKSAMLGYLNAPSPFDSQGWFNTQDKVIVKGEYIKILGRTTDIINVGGQKVYPSEVENILLSIDGVKDAHVYGEENPIMGKVVVADVYVEHENNNRDFIKSLRRYCSQHLERLSDLLRFGLQNKLSIRQDLRKRDRNFTIMLRLKSNFLKISCGL